MILVHHVAVLVLLIATLSAYPLVNVTQQQPIDEFNPGTSGPSSSPSIVVEDNKQGLTGDTSKLVLSNNVADMGNSNIRASSTTRRSSSTARPVYTTTHSSPDHSLKWWQIVLIVFGCLCFCCCCASGSSKAKSGRWVPGYVWVSD